MTDVAAPGRRGRTSGARGSWRSSRSRSKGRRGPARAATARANTTAHRATPPTPRLRSNSSRASALPRVGDDHCGHASYRAPAGAIERTNLSAGADEHGAVARSPPGDVQRRARVWSCPCAMARRARRRAWWIAWRMRRRFQCRSAGGWWTVVRVAEGADDGVAELREGRPCPIDWVTGEGAVSNKQPESVSDPCPINGAARGSVSDPCPINWGGQGVRVRSVSNKRGGGGSRVR